MSKGRNPRRFQTLWAAIITLAGLVLASFGGRGLKLHGFSAIRLTGLLSGLIVMVLTFWIWKCARNAKEFRDATREARVLFIPMALVIGIVDTHVLAGFKASTELEQFTEDIFSTASSVVYASGLLIGLLDLYNGRKPETPDTHSTTTHENLETPENHPEMPDNHPARTTARKLAGFVGMILCAWAVSTPRR